ncbi:MAG TPA: cobalamin adenosyltransferase [Candidatus Merdenecus merdavium]|nr:cobalamin adenosyltransferase [Candidatus Merdenecus merdavium]
MSLVTEDDVRKMLASHQLKPQDTFHASPKQIITPSAKELFNEKNISIITDEGKKEEYSMTYETLFGAKIMEKPEHMTHLRGNILVFKDHPMIAFRGAIDSLESTIILIQTLLDDDQYPKLIQDLEEVVQFVHSLIKFEITGEPLGEFQLLGLDAKALRDHSHHPSKYYGISHFIPNHSHGMIVAYLNKLRTLARETELVAYQAFKKEEGLVAREDILTALNRLSSLFWIMMFQYMDHQYEEK